MLTDEAAKKLEQQVAAQSEQLNAPIDANRAAPPSGGDRSPGPYGNVGGYNNFWLDPGSRFTAGGRGVVLLPCVILFVPGAIAWHFSSQRVAYWVESTAPESVDHLLSGGDFDTI